MDGTHTIQGTEATVKRWTVNESPARHISWPSRIRFAYQIGVALILIWSGLCHATTTRNELRIGILAHRGSEVVSQSWSPTARYLEAQMSGYKFNLVPLELYETWAAVQNQWIDLLLTNPGNFVEISEKYDLRPIATLRNIRQGKAHSQFGAVIFTRRDRNDINSIADLRGKSFMGVKQSGFGGFQLAWAEMLDNGIDPFRDFSKLHFSGYPQDAVALAVRDGLVDVGAFRTDTLEAMAQAGLIELDDFKILNKKQSGDFPFLLSTALYPEWSMVALKHVDVATVDRVKKALLDLPAQSDAAKAANIEGWTEPLDHTPVHQLFQRLRIGPYSTDYDMSPAAVFKAYWLPIFSGSAIVLVMVLAVFYVFHINRRLDAANSALAAEIKERKDAEAALRDHRDHLGEIVRARTADLESANQAALQANRAKSQFLASMSHELRTPLNAIIGYSELLLESHLGAQDTDQVKDLRKIHSAGNYLLALVNGILDLSKIEAGRMEVHCEVIDLRAVVEEIVATIKPLADKNNNKLIVSASVDLGEMNTDSTKLRQILFNVLSNACKFTDHGQVELQVHRVASLEGVNFYFTVEDSGIGIPDYFLDRLFDPFSQADPSVQHKYGGTGLGLAIAKRFCDLLGGSISVRSATDRGTRFEIRIPAVLPLNTESAQTTSPGSQVALPELI